MERERDKTVDKNKIISVLYELSKENFSVSDDTILDKLYVHIENSSDIRDYWEQLLPDVCNWLDLVLNLWNGNKIIIGVKIFTIRLIGFVGSTSLGFSNMRSKNILFEIEKLISSDEIQSDSCIMVPLLNVLKLFLNHQEGFNWIIKTGVWGYVGKCYYGNQSMYTNRSVVKFIASLLSKLTLKDFDNYLAVLQSVCGPLMMENILIMEPNVTKYNLRKFFEPKNFPKWRIRSAKYLYDILEELFSMNECLCVQLKLEHKFSRIFAAPQYEDYQELILLDVKLEIANAFSFAINNKSNDSICPLSDFHSIINQSIIRKTYNKDFNNLIFFCVSCLALLSNFKQKSVPYGHYSCDLCSSIESVLVSKLKELLTSKEFHPSVKMIHDSDENGSGEESCRNFSESFYSTLSRLQRFQDAVNGLTRSLNYISQDSKKSIFSAVVSKFQSLHPFYGISSKEQRDTTNAFIHLVTLASALVETSHLPFRTSQEFNDTSLYTEVLAALNTLRDSRVIVSCLQLLNKIIRFQIMPYLLCAAKEYEQIDIKVLITHLKTLFPKLREDSWEVRDTTLEVYQTMLEASSLTPWYFVDVFQGNILMKIYEISENDYSSYVRASALKFFSMTVRAKLYLSMASPNSLCELAMKSLLQDEMPEPRRAACELLLALSLNCSNMLQTKLNDIYEKVYLAYLKDLDWEVKKATLRFWFCTIDKLLSDENVILSPCWKCSSKPPNIKEDAILKIIRVMEKLNDIGCFETLWLAVTDECDISVSEEACLLINHLEEFDKKWDFIDCILNMEDDENIKVKKMTTKDFFIFIRKKEWQKNVACRADWIANSCDDLGSLLDHILNLDNQKSDWDHNAVDCY